MRLLLLALPAALLLVPKSFAADPVPEFRDLFNGKDLTGWARGRSGTVS
jgi:hypothetical protein